MTAWSDASSARRNLKASLAVAVFAVLAFGSGDDKDSPGTSNTGGSQGSGSSQGNRDVGKTAAAAAPLGTKLVIGGLETEVVRASISRTVSGGLGSHSAGDGATLLVVTYRVKNTTNEAIQAASFADAALNAQGQSFEPSMECNMSLPRETPTLGFSDTLNPGLPKTFGVCFEVPEGSAGWVLKVNRSLEDGFLQTGS